jgi:hypothetical protein
MSRWLTALGLVAIVSIWAMTASAAPGDGSGQGTGGQNDDVIVATATVRTSGGTDSGSASDCSWDLADTQIGMDGLIATWPQTRDGVTYHLYRRTCDGAVTYVEVAETEPRDLLPGLLTQLRERSLPKPVPVFQLLDRQYGWAYVQTPLDFRAGGDSWRPVSVTAAVGPVWATVTAEPISLTFDPGDPAGSGPVSCGGDDAVAPYGPEVPGACAYTYRNASSTSPVDGYHFQTSMSIEWSISWTSSTGAGGALEPYTTSTSTPLAVAEVKGLIVCTGPRPEQGGC